MKAITTAELARLLASSPPRLLDILPEESFSRVHLPAAENIPAAGLSESALDRIGRDETIVVYGAGVDCRATPKAVAQLEELGGGMSTAWPAASPSGAARAMSWSMVLLTLGQRL